MRNRLVLVLLAALVFGAAGAASHRKASSPQRVDPTQVAAVYAHDGSVVLPDRNITPGVPRPDATAKQLCAKGFTTRAYRHTTAKMKKQVCAEYGVKDCPKAGAMEIDHLIPLEVGGEDAIANLWVQPSPQYHWKDALENKLKAMVCAGKLELSEAQRCLSVDWAACYRKEIGPLPK